MPVVAECLGSHIDGTSRTIEYTYFIAELLFYKTVDLDTEVKSGSDIGSNSIQRMREDDRSCE